MKSVSMNSVNCVLLVVVLVLVVVCCVKKEKNETFGVRRRQCKQNLHEFCGHACSTHPINRPSFGPEGRGGLWDGKPATRGDGLGHVTDFSKCYHGSDTSKPITACKNHKYCHRLNIMCHRKPELCPDTY